MRYGANVDIDMPTRDPLTWKVDGKLVVGVYKGTAYVFGAEKHVDAVFLVTGDGSEYPIWNPKDEE